MVAAMPRWGLAILLRNSLYEGRNLKLRQTILLFLLIVSVGCGGNDGPPRIPLSGEIEADGFSGPINGSIAILPDGNTKGPAANGLVQDGEFEFTTDDGPVAGSHRVIIDIEPARGKMDDPENASLQWKFEFSTDVPAEAPYRKNFKLTRDE